MCERAHRRRGPVARGPASSVSGEAARKLLDARAEARMAALLVRDLMTDRVISVRRSTRMDEVYDLMLDHGFRHVPVVDEDDELVGIVSQRDVAALLGPESRGPLMRQAELLSDQRAADVMTPAVETVEPDDDLVVAAEILLEYKFSCLPVVEGSRLVGILTESDFVRHAARSG